MNLNKVASDLVFLGCSIKEIKSKNNIVNLAPDAKINIGMNVSVKHIEEGNPQNGATPLCGYIQLDLDLDITAPENKQLKCKFKIGIEGCFTAEALNRESFEKMLIINGGTTLYSIARSQILDFTSNMFMTGKVLLPLINMVEFFEEMKSQEDKGAVDAK